MEQKDTINRWYRTAWGRLKFELAGLAFAMKNGFYPEDYARHLHSNGAVKWMGAEAPTVRNYLLKEAEAFQTLYPQVNFEISRIKDDKAELIFCRGTCLGGWGKNQWGMAHRLGLGKGHVCRYCRQAFRSWSAQLGLKALPMPRTDETCILTVEKAD
ncbi:MAG: hypothetical protein Q8O55_08615 [Dehalococcoidales bacterium]|nr:hypothetical protein [Dehalococcoidales bacterium]